MDVIYAFSLLAVWFAAVVASRFLSTLIHELGHAIPALLFTKDEVYIFIGSYGEKEASSGLKIGRIIFIVSFKIAVFNMGMCAHSRSSSPTKSLLIALGGPVASLMLGIAVIIMLVQTNWSDGVISLWSILAFSGIWDFFMNIIPTANPQMMGDKIVLHNDGAMIVQHWQERKLPKTFFEAQKMVESDNPVEGVSLIEDVISAGHHSRVTYRQLIESQFSTKQYADALVTFEQYAHRFSLKATDHYLLGKIHYELNDYENALRSARAATHLDHMNGYYLVLQGKALLQLGEFPAALKKFDGALHHNTELFEAYTGRSLVYVRMDNMPAALADLEKAKEMEPENFEVYWHYGLYYQALGQKMAAKEHFEKAKELGSTHHGLDYIIEDLRERTNW